MKLSIISLSGIALFSCGQLVTAQSFCAEKIDKAQQCTKQCVSTESLNLDENGAPFGNLLFECLGSISGDDISNQLGTCCGMNSYDDAACATAMEEATVCLQGELSRVAETSKNYLNCIKEKRTNQECPFADLCVAILAGGYGKIEEGTTNDFGVGYDMNLGRMTREATTCQDMDIFGKNACTEVQGCCGKCADGIAAVVNAVVDDLLLPAYSTLRDCGGNKECVYYMEQGERQLENAVESPSAGSPIIDIEDSMDTTALAGQCNDDLVNEIVLYNTTFAASNFFGCLHNTMGKIIAEVDANEQDAERTSSSTIYGATATALSTIVSALIALV